MNAMHNQKYLIFVSEPRCSGFHNQRINNMFIYNVICKSIADSYKYKARD